MIFHKIKGKIYKVEYSPAEQKAMHLEINQQLVERDENYKEDIDAMVLYALMVHKGWKKKRLRAFWKAFIEVHKALREYYLMDEPGDNEWLAHRELKRIGVDIHQWYKEDAENDKNE